MPRFFLIDPWLADAKGHNYQYALDVAAAAHQRGFEPILAVRDSLSPDLHFPDSWRVEKVFRYGDCPRHWIGLDGRNPHACDVDGAWLPDLRIRWWQRLIDLASRSDRRRRMESFSQRSTQFFAKIPPQEADVLFLPTLTDFDFLCAVRFWRDHPWTRDFDWHLQFHFNFLIGRDPEFVDQPDVLAKFQRLFRAAVDLIPEHRLHFYATSEAIARQYDALGVAIYRHLPYPVRPLCDPEKEQPRTGKQPLRVTRPGAMRREKGKKVLGPILDSTWDEFLRPGRLQFVFQASPQQIEQWLPSRLRGTVRVPPAGSTNSHSPLLAMPHPLDAEQYAELIRGSDIGLLMYDSRRYFTRVSGVLCEMLSAGVPVIVPAGCWLADQIAEENYRYVDQLWRQEKYPGSVEPIEVAPNSNRLIELPFVCDSMLVRFAWPADALPGTYAELRIETASSRPEKLPVTQRAILGPRESGFVGAVVGFDVPVTSLRVSVKSAFEGGSLVVAAAQILPVPPPSSDKLSSPLGSVGLIAADEQELPRLLRDMTSHYDHYARTAWAFAKRWQARHSPLHTISQLESRTRSTSMRQKKPAA